MERIKRVLLRLLRPHWALILLLTAVSGVGLFYIFTHGMEETIPAYGLYALSAYSLSVLCICLVPGVIRLFRRLRSMNIKRKFGFLRYTSLVINLAFSLFNLAGGTLYRSSWLASSGLYYLMLSAIHFLLLRYQSCLDKIPEPEWKEQLGWKCFRICGYMLLLLNLTMTGIVFQKIWQGKVSEYPGFFIFAVAAYTFYRLTASIIRAIPNRKIYNPVSGASANLGFFAALMALFSLQTALLRAFGQDESFALLMNTLTGAAVCLLVVLGALSMVILGNKKIGQRNEGEKHGRK